MGGQRYTRPPWGRLPKWTPSEEREGQTRANEARREEETNRAMAFIRSTRNGQLQTYIYTQDRNRGASGVLVIA